MMNEVDGMKQKVYSKDFKTIDNRILIYLDVRSPINQPYKMLPPEVESARHFDLNITQRNCHS